MGICKVVLEGNNARIDAHELLGNRERLSIAFQRLRQVSLGFQQIADINVHQAERARVQRIVGVALGEAVHDGRYRCRDRCWRRGLRFAC
jgi:hypothetical protein